MAPAPLLAPDRPERSLPWVALVGPEVEENLSLRYLAASLERAGLRAEILPFNSGADLPVLLSVMCAEPQPAVAALSLSFQWRAMDVLALAMALREHGFTGHITAGGHFGSFAWREVMAEFAEIDTICLFEAEETLYELCLAVTRPLGPDPSGRPAWHGVPGIVFHDTQGQPQAGARRRPPALATLPWPDRRGPAAHCLGHRIAALVGSRGCYGNCSFCCIATLHRQREPADRHRLRDPDDVAAEMVDLHKRRGVEIFIFHDDNFFLPRHEDSLRRIHALGDALDARGLERFATVVKARPNDVTVEVMTAMRERLQLVRLFLGVESSTTQGTRTLNRGVTTGAAERALGVIDGLELYCCFNMLVFDPDASVEDLLGNMAFMEAHGEHPSNFGRVELYAGTPLLQRLLAEGRAVGDYISWNYDQGTPEMQRIFELTMEAFFDRNFSGHALANRLQSTRFDVEVARHFHPERWQPEWLARAKDLNRRLAHSSAEGVRRTVAQVRSGERAQDAAFVQALTADLRAAEAAIEADASALEQAVNDELGVGCDHAPPKGIPVPRSTAEPVQHYATIDGCGVAD